MKQTSKNNVFIIGDYVKDFHLIKPESKRNIKNKDFDLPELLNTHSGCGLYKNLLGKEIEVITYDEKQIFPESYTIWESTEPVNIKNKPNVKISSFLGVHKKDKADFKISSDLIADVIVIEDLNIGFRSFFNKEEILVEYYNSFINENSSLIYKTTHDFDKNKVYQWISKLKCGKKIIVLKDDVIINEMSKINSYVSWNSLLQNFKQEIDSKDFIKKFKPFDEAFIQFDCTAIFHITKKMDDDFVIENIVYDPNEIPKQYISQSGVNSFGTTAALVSNIIPYVLNKNDITICLLTAMGKIKYLVNKFADGIDSQINNSLVKLFEEISVYSRKQTSNFSSNHKLLCIGKDKQNDIEKKDIFFSEINDTTAENIVRKGVEFVGNLPKIMIGEFISINNSEIEQLNSIRKLIINYKNKKDSKPLSIAVFGEPGSGKSFCVKQLMQEIFPGQKDCFLEFNLSQFNDSSDIGNVFQKARDMSIKNKIPIIFWDEFDSSNLKWLKYFLMPMNDGEFYQNGTRMSLSKAIFIFAGGCYEKFEDFAKQGIDKEKNEKNGKGSSDSNVNKKVPDFCSRLQGYINITGINYNVPARDKLIVKITRAILINTLIRKHFENITNGNELNIADNVLKSLLEVGEFRHGVRSLEAIIKMSSNKDHKKFTRSCLPLSYQLRLHVDDALFLQLLNT